VYNHFQKIDNINGLISLYQSSQTECSRSAGLTPEIGSSRERDVIASLCHNKVLSVVYDIPNKSEEDVIVNNKKISIKHSSNKKNSCSGIKIIWTVDTAERLKFVKKFVFSCDLLIIYVRFDREVVNGQLEILYIERSTLLHQQQLSNIRNEEIFKCLDGNSRGIELHKKFFDVIINKALFHIIIKFTVPNHEKCDPITKRVQYLQSIQK
jgi:hypothetical protein